MMHEDDVDATLPQSIAEGSSHQDMLRRLSRDDATWSEFAGIDAVLDTACRGRNQ